jgi:hypothetical protein
MRGFWYVNKEEQKNRQKQIQKEELKWVVTQDEKI